MSTSALIPPAPARKRRALLAVALVSALPSLTGLAPAPAASDVPLGGSTEAYGSMPLSFVPSLGQADGDVLFAGQAGGFGVQFTQREARLTFADQEVGHVLA